MPATTPAPARGPKLTLRAIMVATGLIAVVLAAVRPLGRVAGEALGPLRTLFEALGTVENALVLGCLVLGLVAMWWLLRNDEAG